MARTLPSPLLRKDQVTGPDGRLDVDRLLSVLNSNLAALQAALANGLTLEENALAEKVTRAGVSTTSFPLYLTPKRVKSPQHVLLRIREDVPAPNALASAPFADWDVQADGRIKVQNITGLTAGRTYVATFLLLAG